MEPLPRAALLRRGAIFREAALPASFGDPLRESAAALQGCVAADRSDLGRLWMRGKDRLDLLHRLSTQEILALRPGEGALTALLNVKGRVVDLLQVLVGDAELLLLTSPGQGEQTRAWLEQYIFREEVALEDAASLAGIGLYGPAAGALLGSLAAESWKELPPYHHTSLRLAGVQARIARTFPLAGSGFLLLAAAEEALPLWESLLDAGAAPAGSEALESLRVAAGVPGWGRELTAEHNPWEAGLDAAISLTKGCYLGQEVVARLHNYRKVQRRLAALRLAGPPPPKGSPVFQGGGEIGAITSAAPSPEGEGSAALGILKAGPAGADAEILVRHAGLETRGVLVPLPGLTPAKRPG